MSSIRDILSEAKNFDGYIKKHFETIRRFFFDYNGENPDIVYELLDVVFRVTFLKYVQNIEDRYLLAEKAFQLIQNSNYSLLDMFKQRLDRNKESVLFRDMGVSPSQKFTYQRVNEITKSYAASFISSKKTPRVAILTDNAPYSAMADLSCLFYGIFVTPLNINFSKTELISIFKQLDINIVVTDKLERLKLIDDIKKELKQDIDIFTTKVFHNIELYSCRNLNISASEQTSDEVENIIQSYKPFAINEVSTIMFTSGSTGVPKGISFSNYSLVSKRFARGAAVPFVGDNEVMLSYLPLFHTFGRYLELLGTIYWNGTYVFTGSPSSSTLFKLFPIINPSIFISIPLRWQQAYDKIMQVMDKNRIDSQTAIETVVGKKLKWGLSAAGYLDPKVFKFFNQNNIKLSSGFGMTEATGGITMTPPGEYVLNSTGVALPGIYPKLKDNGEMLISGHYVAEYLQDAPIGSEIEYPKQDDSDYYVATGDIFNQDKLGHYQIIDRVKDIYKNNKGQTIAPRNVESKFEGVPGIKRVFLVGDGRPYNILFIVTDKEDELIENLSQTDLYDYLHKLIMAANKSLARYERVVNFKILETDFNAKNGELTAKQSFNRKLILKNYSNIIESCYERNYVDLKMQGFFVRIPRWFYRDLGILESDILIRQNSIYDKVRQKELTCRKIDDSSIQIGNLIYDLDGNIIDFEILAKQPLLWAGNYALTQFAPVKEIWEMDFKNIGQRVKLPLISANETIKKENFKTQGLSDLVYNYAMILANRSLDNQDALTNIQLLANNTDSNLLELIRLRLESLAYHPVENIRCRAYMILLTTDAFSSRELGYFTFLESGFSFLNEEYIAKITSHKFEKRRLETLRQRLFIYRTQLDWPVNRLMIKQFENIFKLLVKYVKKHEQYYEPVRSELVNWMMHDEDEKITEIAHRYFIEVSEYYEKKIQNSFKPEDKSEWKKKIIFDDGVPEKAKAQLFSILTSTTFLKQSIMLAYDQKGFCLDDLTDYGIWLSNITHTHENNLYRMCINTKEGQRYDFQIVINENLKSRRNLETVFWLMIISAYPYGTKVLPKLGCARPELNARSVIYNDELTAWGHIRILSNEILSSGSSSDISKLQKIFVYSMKSILIGWRNSGKRIIPGFISLSNIILPNKDYMHAGRLLSLNGWVYYSTPISIILPIYRNFFKKAVSHYSWISGHLDLNWIFDAIIEVLGEKEGKELLEELYSDLQKYDFLEGRNKLLNNLKAYLREFPKCFTPIIVLNAIENYITWNKLNPSATVDAITDSIFTIYDKYELNDISDFFRFYYYRHTYFRNHNSEVKHLFDRLLRIIESKEYSYITELNELSDLQFLLQGKNDRLIFSKMVYPHQLVPKQLSFDTTDNIFGNMIKTKITDTSGNGYYLSETFKPSEIGILYRLFHKENYTMKYGESYRYFILNDKFDRIVGGLSFREIDDKSVFLDGTVLVQELKGVGLGTAMLEVFFDRMLVQNIEIVKTHFEIQAFLEKIGFKLDKNYGAMVKFLK